MFKKLYSGFNIPIRYHIIFWITYFLFNFIRWGSYFNDYWYSLKSNLVEFPLHIIITYFVIYYLIPKFIVKKKYIHFFILLIVSLGLLYIIRTGLNYFLVSKNIWPEAEGIQQAFTFNHIIAVVLGEIYVISLVSVIKLTNDWINEIRKNDALKKIQLRTELNFLKTQIQPHFYFNTLNNLYALVIDKSPKAPDVVMKLSEIMQYVLYEAKEPRISLLKEINYVHSYLELEKLRYENKIKSIINIVGDVDDIEIPPLLFLPFIENCFKHGTKNNDDIKVEIGFEINNNFLSFTVDNTFQNNDEKFIKHGIGIENVKRRLFLLYKDDFSLETKIKNNKFKVLLKLPIQ
ncbi:MAG: sensor histidine kinase [Flavobacteriaceae bacterium]|nr:sensor histidine kinase [Flavobacteriaceae bacterium]